MELDDLPKEKLKELIHEVTDDVADDENVDDGDDNLVKEKLKELIYSCSYINITPKLHVDSSFFGNS